jgi:hypothetical protein
MATDISYYHVRGYSVSDYYGFATSSVMVYQSHKQVLGIRMDVLKNGSVHKCVTVATISNLLLDARRCETRNLIAMCTIHVGSTLLTTIYITILRCSYRKTNLIPSLDGDFSHCGAPSRLL